MKIYLVDEREKKNNINLCTWAKRWGLEQDIHSCFQLTKTSKGLTLCKRNEPTLGTIFVDFNSKRMNFRRKHMTYRNEAIAKAVGIREGYFPNIIDATAGFGRDAFILASLGCFVMMLERNPVVAALLDDGLKRAVSNVEIGDWVRNRLILIYSSLLYPGFNELIEKMNISIDVIYLDPMYPLNKKSALVKKEMQFLQLLVGIDKDSNAILDPARQLAKKRIVVKRPLSASPLANVSPNSVILTKKHRFDIYLPST